MPVAAHGRSKARLVNAQAIASGATATADIDAAGYDRLTVIAKLAATTTPADMTLTVRPYLDDGTTLCPIALPAAATSGPTASGSDLWAIQTFDLRGIDKLQAEVKNSNAGSKAGTLIHFTLN